MGFQFIQISKKFSARKTEITALDGINFSIKEHEFVCIVGPSGCGKTTLLKIIAGLLKPTTGKITIDVPANSGRPQNAMVFQDQGLFPWMTVMDNVAFGLEMHNVKKSTRLAKAGDFLDRVGLGAFINNYPHELSGGMKQRVAILRAFLTDPLILLMDEPFAGLDSQTRLLMQEELLRIWKDDQKTVIYVTHDIEEAILLGDRILVMSGRPGKFQADIPVHLPRPRQLSDLILPDVVELNWHIWKMIEAEVRKELKISK